ncbi:MAG: flagellar assembly protein FliH [Deltaproteobacteria bacterium]|nr:flagellar assembly protein FliH [Deltaproteobacteria bacterium]
MGKVIKKGELELGDISPDTGFAEAAAIRRPGIIKSDTIDAKSEAQRIVERAQAEAVEIRKAAELEAEKLKEQAYALGMEEGKNNAATELSQVVATASQRLSQIEAQVEPQLKELALTIAKKILGKELEFHPEAVVDIVKQALSEKARQRREIYLRVNPDDLQYIRDHKADLLEVLSRAKEIGIREDPDVAPHGVVIETDAGMIDAQLETQLAVFERVLMGKG